MAKDIRFERVMSEGNALQTEGFRMILVDKETGVNYLVWQNGSGAAITPLLGEDGKPVIYK